MAKLFRITTVPISVEKLLGKQLTFINQYFEVTAISSDKEYLDRVGQELGVKTHSIEMTRKITPLQDIKSLWQMYRYIKKESPEIVHTHTPKAGLIGMVAAKLAGVKIRLHTVAGLPLMESTGLKRKVLNAVEKFTYNCATRIYPNSKGLHDFILKEKLGEAHKLKIIGNGSTNGIDTSYFDPVLFSAESKLQMRKELGFAEEDFVFVFVGRLVKDKGINELVFAFKAFQDSIVPTPKLLLVGPFEQELDPLFPEVLNEIQTNQNIKSVGFQKDVRDYFAVSDALVFPSYREGFPNVVMQAGAMGLPAIVSDINGCNEIIIHEENGIIIPVKSEEHLMIAMRRIVLDVNLNDKMKKNARTLIVQRYQQKLIWQELRKEYELALI